VFKRLFWTMVGVGLGAVVGVQVVRWANRTTKRYAPETIARNAAGGWASLKQRAAEAVAAGAAEMDVREAELRAELNLPEHR
jgi:hypothetical protein